MLLAAPLAAMIGIGTAAANFDAGWDAYQRGEFRNAMAEWEKASEQGDDRADYNLGILYSEGRGVAIDHEKAAALWTKAADKGNADAMHNLALAHLTGDGVEQSHDMAADWLDQAADAGSVRSAYALGKMYEFGLGVGPGPDEGRGIHSAGREHGLRPRPIQHGQTVPRRQRCRQGSRGRGQPGSLPPRGRAIPRPSEMPACVF